MTTPATPPLTLSLEEIEALEKVHAATVERNDHGVDGGVTLATETFGAMLSMARRLLQIQARRFPVLGGGMTVSWQMLVPFEPQAITNHQQSLQRLAERGGLSWAEMLCVLECRRWNVSGELTDEEAKSRVLALVDAYEAKLGWDPTKAGR